jgi:hypothetical protein
LKFPVLLGEEIREATKPRCGVVDTARIEADNVIVLWVISDI